MEGRPGRRRGAIHPQLTPRFTPSPRPGAAPSHASETKTKASVPCLTACVTFDFLFHFLAPFPRRLLGGFGLTRLAPSRFPLLARLLREVCERGGRERVRGSRRSRGRSVEPRPRAPPRTATVPHGGGRTRRDPCAGCALADAPPSRGPKPHGGATRCAAACDGDLLPSSRRGGGKGEIPFLPPPPLQAREGRPIARASCGRKQASDRLESTCWRGLASLLATSLDGRNASPSSPQPDPGELTERDGATGVSLSALSEQSGTG
jgi:hypothetical protein